MTLLKECEFCGVQNSVQLYGFWSFEKTLNLTQCQFWIYVFQQCLMKGLWASRRRSSSRSDKHSQTTRTFHFWRARLALIRLLYFLSMLANVHQMYNFSVQRLFLCGAFAHLSSTLWLYSYQCHGWGWWSG